VVKERDVADRQSEDLDLGEFLVRWKGRQHAAQLSECGVERLDTHAFPGRVGRTVAFRRPPVTPALLPATRSSGPCRHHRARADRHHGSLT